MGTPATITRVVIQAATALRRAAAGLVRNVAWTVIVLPMRPAGVEAVGRTAPLMATPIHTQRRSQPIKIAVSTATKPVR